MKKIRIGAGQGFLGDVPFPALDVVRHGEVSYLCCDTLAELTLAILTKIRKKKPGTGFSPDIGFFMRTLLATCKKKKVKIISNCGGLNPEGAVQEIINTAKVQGVKGLKIGVVQGDDIISRLDELEKKENGLINMETGEPLSTIKEDILFANVYLGVEGIVEALEKGADIVVTGRCADTSLFLAPMVYELGWSLADWNKIATGIVTGHLMECSAQSTGGNFSGDWWNVPKMHRPGYPIAEVSENGDVFLTKAEPCGGIVTRETVAEQLIYEIHDPANYLTPDVSADFTSVQLKDLGNNSVSIAGVVGNPRPEKLKVSIGYSNGYSSEVSIRYAWPDALKKAQKAEEIIRKQMKFMNFEPDEMIAEYIGINSLLGPTAGKPQGDLEEVGLRLAIRTKNRQAAEMFPRLFPSLALNGPPSIGGGGFGAARSRGLISLWSALIPREEVKPQVKIVEVD